ncbi:SDR family NAD(P)-dependent oxidoreductase [Mycolicibacterium smegmatis]|uniref:SDR family NAD(P)-dependent oxidoreductase n=1 Tax=Mycolicibacterium smegmatis TaxID=1772 RepID=UPI0005D7C3D5|nr:SDR family NAD(P)-dependent oxidoreductase [Mycolicibacterium smegmatis]MCP2621809.1 SDR family NAD(P)-dependent oxidoreductase [Mycolicibacterium smegmatis]MDF1901760.1 SDR family NAD(P)-dependent oxidoreductase [Mycolicibacterium smegmatis]MDF1905767.1 SDR family NAD(P)-dependent oxidoreductase [Mycolicibacterium smegmatis]MDF1920650.1 SDR family NAD(P)-dependent oxidoreductase [Mycolicibacterium smegmatis]MDF1926632.1 SDR family NAD(P)-dependent oxidoreductase [Mycolicibacterium smegmati
MSADTKWTEADVPDQSGRVAIVTGSNTGLGYETARVLAAKGAHVVIAVRNLDKGRDAVDRIMASTPKADLKLQKLDVGSLDSVRTAADELKSAYPHIDLLINNAGVMYPPKQTTVDGFELQFGTNHLGPFALTGLLIDNLLPVEGSRVVAVASVAHRIRAKIHFEDLQWERRYNRVEAYGQSKLANLLFAYELQRRLAAAGKPTISVAAHPGLSNTELMRHIPGTGLPGYHQIASLFSNSPLMGALATLRAATDPGVKGGEYYGPDGFREVRGHPKLVKSSSQSRDPELQRRLWAVSEELTGVSYPV